MGFSDRDGGFPYGFALWTDQLVQTLDALGVERAAVIGQSLGGAISLVRGPLSSAGRARGQRRLRTLAAALSPAHAHARPRRDAPRARRVLARSAGPEGRLRAANAAGVPDQGNTAEPAAGDARPIPRRPRLFWRARAGRVSELLIQGESDDIIPPRAAQALRKLLSGSELVMIPEVTSRCRTRRDASSRR